MIFVTLFNKRAKKRGLDSRFSYLLGFHLRICKISDKTYVKFNLLWGYKCSLLVCQSVISRRFEVSSPSEAQADHRVGGSVQQAAWKSEGFLENVAHHHICWGGKGLQKQNCQHSCCVTWRRGVTRSKMTPGLIVKWQLMHLSTCFCTICSAPI